MKRAVYGVYIFIVSCVATPPINAGGILSTPTPTKSIPISDDGKEKAAPKTAKTAIIYLTTQKRGTHRKNHPSVSTVVQSPVSTTDININLLTLPKSIQATQAPKTEKS